MKAQWVKKIKRVAVFILTAALLVNAVDCNRLFVKAEAVENAEDDGGGTPDGDGGNGQAPENNDGAGGGNEDGAGGGNEDGAGGGNEDGAGGSGGEEGGSGDGGVNENGIGSGADSSAAEGGSGNGGVNENGTGNGADNSAAEGGSDDGALNGNGTGSGTDNGGEEGGSDDGALNGNGTGSGADSSAAEGGSDDGALNGNGAGSGADNSAADDGSDDGALNENGTGSSTAEGSDGSEGGAESGTVSGNDIISANSIKVYSAAPAAVSAVIVTVRLQDKNGNPIGGATVQFVNDNGSISFAESSESAGSYSSDSEISEDGTIQVEAEGFENGETKEVDFSLADYDADSGLTVELAETRYHYYLNVDKEEGSSGTVKAGDSTVTTDFTCTSDSVELKIAPDEKSYIESVKLDDEEQVNAPTEQAVTVIVQEGQRVAVVFAKKYCTTVSVEGNGKVYWADDAERKDVRGTVYYMPGNTRNLTVKADENWYIASVSSGESKDLYENQISASGEVTPENGKNISVVFCEKWTQESLTDALKAANGFLTAAAYNQSYELKAPKASKEDYSYKWEIAGKAPQGVKIADNSLTIPVNAAGKTFVVKVTAVLSRGTAKEEVVSEEIAVAPGDIIAEQEKDYKFEKSEEWITGIQVFQDVDGNNFTGYKLTGTDLGLSGSMNASGTKIALGEVEVEDAKLVLSGEANGESYDSKIEKNTVLSNLKIDTKAPKDLALSYEIIKEGNRETVEPNENQTYSTKYEVVVTASAADGGSGIEGTEAVLTHGGGQLTSAFDGSGKAEFCIENGDYTFSALTVKDCAGNESELGLNISFSVDTTPPEAPVIDKNNDAWQKGNPMSYMVSSESDDTVKFVICKDDGNVEWEAIEAEVESGSVPDGVSVIEASEASAEWKIGEEGVLNQGYQLKALDGHGNFSVGATSYTVKIDNENPEFTEIIFSKNDTENPLEWEDTLDFQKINAKVGVEVKEISDGEGSGIARVTLADGAGAGAKETELTYGAGAASYTFDEEGDYAFKELRIYDKVGNCLTKALDVNFRIDTTPPSDPVVEANQTEVDSWSTGNNCSYTITSESNAEDTYCFEIYEVKATGEMELKDTIYVTDADVDGDSASVTWNMPLEAEKVLKCSYQIRARDCADTANANYGYTGYTVQIDNRMPMIEGAGFAYADREGTSQKVTADIVTDSDVILSIDAVKDGENPPTDQVGLKSVVVEYTVEERKQGESQKEENQRAVVTEMLSDGKVEWKLPCESGKYYKYSNITVIAEDKLGNTLTYEALKDYTVEIDRRGPAIKAVDWNAGSDDTAYWFNGTKKEHRFLVTVQDDTELAELTIVAVDGQGKAKDSLTRNISGKEVSVDFGEWIYDREAKQAYPDKRETYTVRVKDQFGNETAVGGEEDFSKDRAPKEVRIDKTLPVITGAAYNAAKVTYEFGNVKAPDAAVTDGKLNEKDHLVNGVLLSKEDVTITVNAFDPKMDQDGENADGVASGIVKAELLVETEGKVPEAITFADENPNLEDGHDYVFELKGAQGQETVFVLKKIRLTDLAGNVKEYVYEDGEEADAKLGELTVVVDHKEPESFFNIDKYSYAHENGGLTGWYSAAGAVPLKLAAQASDAYGIHSIEWYRTTYDRGIDVVYKDVLNESENGTAFDDTLELAQDQDQLYAVKVTDWAGNEKVFCRNTTEEDGSRIRIDNTAPENYAYIHWTGDYESSFNDVGNEYEVSKEGFVYNKNKVALSVLVRDGLKDGLLDGEEGKKVSSDIDRVEVTINHEDRSEKLSKSNGNDVVLAEVQGETYLEFTFEGIELTGDADTEVEKYIESIVIYDNAGNRTPAEGRVLDDEIKYILDSKAPRLVIDYHDGSYVENALFPETYFYKADPGINAMIEERYFYPDDVKADLSAPEAEGVLNQSEWSMGSTEHGSVFSAPSDGRYRFSLEYTDRSGNAMIGDDVEGGRYVSNYVVMDTTAPKIEITYEYNGHDVTDEIYDGNFYAGTVTATVRITEMNFDPDMVEIEAVGKNSESNSGIDISWDGAWTQESAEVNVNKVTFDQQGTYQFTCICRDIVGHEAERPAQSHFVVDTTKPEVEITYDLNDPMNEKYYKQMRTATVRVTDRSFDPEQVEFLIETTGPEPVMGEWAHLGGSGCENQPTYHVDRCVYEAKVVFAEDGDYSLGFQCTDKAGNESDVVMTDPFTVDQTVPEMVVTYDNNDVRNEYYYNAERIGTIRITEHNFNPEDVKIVTTARNAAEVVNAPAISGWRSEGDVHTTTIAYDVDADYTFDISFIDMAGNEAEAYAGDRFVVDTTAPVLEITDIEDRSANNGKVAPGIEWSDINLDANGVLLALTGANNGEVVVDTTETSIEGGMKIQYHDFPREKEMDDLYTFHATVSDLAGNVSEQTVLFSVNRFGSVYVFDEVTQDIVDRHYIKYPARLNVTEINVDTLEFKEITYSKDGDIITMKAGEDYNVTESGTEVTWKSYSYDIFDHNFTEEGAYAVTIYSEDRATNKSNNIVKEKVIDFVMDITAPTVVVTGVDDREQYNENSRTITIDAKDNIYLAGVTAYLDDKPVQTFGEEVLMANGGVVTMEIGSSNEWQTLVVRAIDAAGNEGVSDTRVFLITRNILVQWYRNVPLFWGSIAGVIALAAFIIFFLFYKKKKKEEEEKAA